MKVSTILAALILFSTVQSQQPWPVLKKYDKDHLYNISLALGGIGTGTLSLGGRGELRDWQVMNKPGIKFPSVTAQNEAPFFSLFVEQDGKKDARALMGPLDQAEYQHAEGRPVSNYGFPRFRDASFEAAYPFGQVHLRDAEMPVTVTIKGFNPLIPGDENSSGIPAAILRYEVTNTSSKPISAAVCGTMRNFVGRDGSKTTRDWKGEIVYLGAKKNINKFRQDKSFSGIYMYSDSVPATDPAWGSFALTTDAADGVSYRTSSRNNDWNNALLDFWDDFSEDGILTEKPALVDNDPMASLSVKKIIQPGQTVAFNYYLTWHFPNRYAWGEFKASSENDLVGNYYCKVYKDAWDVIQKTLPLLPGLEKKTIEFVNALISSDYPEPFREAALFNLSVLRSQTVFRLPDGHMMGWEGVFDEAGSCFGSCTHVWNYEQATPFLFGNLALTMRDVEFNYATQPNGEMKFRTSLPLTKPQTWWGAAADGQMGCVMKMYREWQLSGNEDFLKKNWPQVKKVLGYAWRKGGWDANMDGAMEGEQHNTMDVNYYGPNPQMAFWYLGALKAAEKMALAMKDKRFADTCRKIFTKGSTWVDANLFNGEYYEQKITDPKTFEYLADSSAIPDYQLGRGCLVDQLVGQMMASILGLGYLGDSSHMRTTLASIMKYNFRESFSDHFNNMRSYVLGNESGLLMASWPKGRLKVPFPYFNESMTGFEYTAAIGMLYQNMETEAEKCVSAIRNRFDGGKRNPFDEPECGHYYARSMTSWGTLLAWTDFHYSGVDRSMSFGKRSGKFFWSNGYAWGTVEISDTDSHLTVLHGSLDLKKLTVGGKNIRIKNAVIAEGQSIALR